MIDCEVIFMPISPVLDRCILFHGLNDHDTASALAFFHAREHSYSRGESLRRPGDPVKSFGLVLEGQVHVLMDDFEGNRMLMSSVQPGNTFAESLCYLGLESQIQIEAVTNSRILLMDTISLKQPARILSVLDQELFRRFTAMLAQRTLALNNRIQTLSKLTIRQKVITLLSEYKSVTGEPDILLPFNREAMAIYLGVNQNALSRELSKMRDDGIITFNGSHFTILKG